MKKKFVLLIAVAAVVLIPVLAFGSVESSLGNISTRLITTILPLISILGLVFAAISFAMGNQNARGHLFLALTGAAIGFGAPSIIAFIKGMIQ